MKPPKTLLALLVALAMVAAACGGDDGDPVATGEPQTAEPAEEPADEPMDEPMEEEAAEEPMDEPMEEEPAEEPEAATDDAFPVTIAAGNGEVTIEARPERIVSISTVATETLFAIGAGDQVIAVDSLSNFPPEAPVTDLSGFTPSVEAIAEFEKVEPGNKLYGDSYPLPDNSRRYEVSWCNPKLDVVGMTERVRYYEIYAATDPGLLLEPNEELLVAKTRLDLNPDVPGLQFIHDAREDKPLFFTVVPVDIADNKGKPAEALTYRKVETVEQPEHGEEPTEERR